MIQDDSSPTPTESTSSTSAAAPFETPIGQLAAEYAKSVLDPKPLQIQRGEHLQLADGQVAVDASEMVQLCAVDTELFARTFFPRAFRQESPSFAPRIWSALESGHRLVNIQVFRGGSKTTRLRAFIAKRVAYGLSRTILVIGKSESHSLRTIAWLRKQIDFNTKYTQVYGLRRGTKWTDEECEIFHDVDEIPIRIIGMGITGSVRGINQDDFRPDLIVLDDIHNEENSATRDQRQKIDELVYGAILEALAPQSEAPHAMLCNLATPLDGSDTTSKALGDPAWFSVQIPCWTPETLNLPTHLQKSVWPERWSDKVLRQEKSDASRRNMLSSWLREKELRITSPETSAFRAEWLRRYKLLPEQMTVYMAIDPVPPPSEVALAKGLHKNDYEAFAVIGEHKHNFYVLEISANRGHDPSWTVAEFFRLCFKFKPQRIFVEAVAYQRTLQWILKQEMKRRGTYFAIEDFPDQGGSKYNRIVDGLNAPASNGVLYIPEDAERRGEGFQMFVEAFPLYPKVNNDDVLEAVAVALRGAQGLLGSETSDGGVPSLEDEAKEYPKLVYERGAP